MAKQNKEEEPESSSDVMSLTGSGDPRVKVQAHVNIFHLRAGDVGYLSRTEEVNSAIESKFLSSID